MKKQMLTLWDFVEKVLPRKARPPVPAPKAPSSPARLVSTQQPAPRLKVAAPSKTSMQDKYDAMVRDMLAKYGVRVRRWRTAMSGIAWELRYHDGRTARLIESPRPKGPMSAAIFLHEIGHHAIGFNTYKPRCREEYYAWAFAIEQMEKLGLNITDNVRKRMHDSLHYAVAKARRRGLRELPVELEVFAERRWVRPK